MSTRIWLRRSFNRYWLFDLDRGVVVRSKRRRPLGARPAGIARRCGWSLVATYVTSAESLLYAQVGQARRPLDGQTRAIHTWGFKGLVSRLQLTRVGEPTLSVWDFVLIRRIIRVDYEDLVNVDSDFLLNVADIVNSHYKRQSVHEAWRPGGLLDPSGEERQRD